MTERIGILGGTFDPVHVGHLAVAQDVLHRLELDRVLLIPAGTPPHRADAAITPAEVRVEMVEAAVEGVPGLEVSRLEVDRDGPSWTVDTVEMLARRCPQARLFLVLGADQWARFHTWRAPERILERTTPVVVGRNGEAGSDMEVPHLTVETPRLDISSSGIRRRVRAGEPIRFLVPEAVRRIIERHALYQEGST